jgi:hypothetical protein
MPLHPSSLRIFYANLRSIRKTGKLDEIKCILQAVPRTIHIMVFTETWITSEEDAKLYEISNYNHIYNYRKERKGGGVSIYIHDSIKYEITENTVNNGNHFLWVCIDKLSLNIGGIYRPGDTNLIDFMDSYVLQLERRKRSIVFGDFNVDLLANDNQVTQYRNIIQENGYEIINKIDTAYSTRQTK